ncbi:MAG: squalene synthase HpnC [Bacteroidetes bacterium]|nr:squalene synthase HpnC [Bacteroidota bacterium]
MDKNLEEVYGEVIEFASSHYENFPVISKFVAHNLRHHVAVIYWFARTADDFADEGDFTPEERLKLLDDFEKDFYKALKHEFANNHWKALCFTIEQLHLTPEYFTDLLVAFKQDVTVKRYDTFDDVLKYCRYSANPVGRLVLELHGFKDGFENEYSDNICTALQLANFYQDVNVDIRKDRIYIPLDEMIKFGVTEADLKLGNYSDEFRTLMSHQVYRNQELFDKGKKLLSFLPNKLKVQIKWTVLGGEKILNKIKRQDYNVLVARPSLNKLDYFILMIKALF